MLEKKIILKRFISFFIDLTIYGGIGGVIGFLVDKVDFFKTFTDYVFYILLLLFLFKDLITIDGSFGKKIMGLKIIDSSTGKNNFILRKVLRNITSVIWPIEALVMLGVNKRISDKLFFLDVIPTGNVVK